MFISIYLYIFQNNNKLIIIRSKSDYLTKFGIDQQNLFLTCNLLIFKTYSIKYPKILSQIFDLYELAYITYITGERETILERRLCLVMLSSVHHKSFSRFLTIRSKSDRFDAENAECSIRNHMERSYLHIA